MADNTDYFPQIRTVNKPNEYVNSTIRGRGNTVDKTAENVIVNGANNYVGEGCRDVNLLNSSGCTVSSGVVGINMISCSGLTAFDSGKIYIENVEISDDSFISSGSTYSQSFITVSGASLYYMTTANYTVVSAHGSNEIYLPEASGQTQVFNLKNQTGGDFTWYPFGSGNYIEDESSIITADGESITLQSDGSSNYIII